MNDQVYKDMVSVMSARGMALKGRPRTKRPWWRPFLPVFPSNSRL